MTLPRGFKARAERDALTWRTTLGVGPTDPLDLNALAKHERVAIVSADALIDVGRLEELERMQAYSFSAATFEIGDRSFIVTNPLRSAERRASDVAHELSHVLLLHELSEIREVDGIPFRTCQPDQEEQATSFGATLLLPRPLLLSAAKAGMGPEQIAAKHRVTLDMARFRFNTTGVAKQARLGPR